MWKVESVLFDCQQRGTGQPSIHSWMRCRSEIARVQRGHSTSEDFLYWGTEIDVKSWWRSGLTWIHLQFFDIGGSLSHKNSRGVFYQQTNGIILVHDVTNRKSHENLKNWLVEIVNKESGKDTIKSSYVDQDLDSEQFLGSCQVSLAIDFIIEPREFKW